MKRQFWDAVIQNDLLVVEQILTTGGERYVNISKTGSGSGFTPLMYAVICGFTAMVDIFLKIDVVDVNFPDDIGQTPLILATRLGEYQIVEKLLKVDGIDVGVYDKWERSALFYLSLRDDVAIAKKLLRVGSVDFHKKPNTLCNERRCNTVTTARSREMFTLFDHQYFCMNY